MVHGTKAKSVLFVVAATAAVIVIYVVVFENQHKKKTNANVRTKQSLRNHIIELVCFSVDLRTHYLQID